MKDPKDDGAMITVAITWTLLVLLLASLLVRTVVDIWSMLS